MMVYHLLDEPPSALRTLTDNTGGLLLHNQGETNPDDPTDYNDDAGLFAIAENLAALLGFEYRLEVTSSIPGDNQIYELQVVASVNSADLIPQTTFFRARSGSVDIAFAQHENGARVTLPLDLQVRVLNSSNPIAQIDVFRIDNDTGEELPLVTLSSSDEIIPITDAVIGAGTLSLVARATDTGGNVGEAFLTLVVVNPNATAAPTATWTPQATATATLPPPTNTPTNTAIPAATLTPTLVATVEPEAPRSSNDSLLIPIVVALMGMTGTLLIGFSLLALAQRRGRKRVPTSTERPTIPKAPAGFNPNAPTASIPVTHVPQQTVRMKKTPPHKDIWKKAIENIDTQAIVSVDMEHAPSAVLLSEKNERFPLLDGENTIGRHSSNMVQIMDSTASRYHAVIDVFGDQIVIMDWQASHPTTVNGNALASGERRQLQTGDEIVIGSTALRLISRN